MDLFLLDKTTRQPKDLIQNYNSLIWTESYRNAGDFSLVSPDIQWTTFFLPLGSFIAISDSKEIQMVENYEIQTNDDGVRTIKVTGRTLDSFLEQRAAIANVSGLSSGGNTVTWAISSRTSAACAKYMMDYHIVSGTVNVNDKLPSVTVINSATGSLTTSARKISRGTLYERVLEVLSEDDLGIRIERPSVGSSTIVFRIYSKTDRSSSVVLSSYGGTIDVNNHVKSIKELKTVAYSSTQDNGSQTTISAALSGFDRRVLTLSHGDITDGFTGLSVEHFSRVKAELIVRKKSVDVFDSSLPPESDYIFGQHYFLGDLITAVTDYFQETTLQVTSFTRVEDENGESSFPTLSTVID